MVNAVELASRLLPRASPQAVGAFLTVAPRILHTPAGSDPVLLDALLGCILPMALQALPSPLDSQVRPESVHPARACLIVQH